MFDCGRLNYCGSQSNRHVSIIYIYYNNIYLPFKLGDLYDRWYLRGLGCIVLSSDNSSKADRDTWNKYKRMINWMENKFGYPVQDPPFMGSSPTIEDVRKTSGQICSAIRFVLNDEEVKLAIALPDAENVAAMQISDAITPIKIRDRVVDNLYIEACNKIFHKLFLTNARRVKAYDAAIRRYLELRRELEATI